jgi:hypothetical protein
MAHGQAKRNHARALTPVFPRYATLPQATKDHRFQQLFAAKCNWRIMKTFKVITSNTLSKLLFLKHRAYPLCYHWVVQTPEE